MLNKIGELIKRQEDFAFETTLAGKSHIRIIEQARKYNYLITLVFFWLDSPELAIERVKIRVDSGGHNVQELIIRRRYINGLQNLFQLYIPIVDYWMIFNNSRTPSEFIAEGFTNKEEKIYNNDIFKLMKNTNNG